MTPRARDGASATTAVVLALFAALGGIAVVVAQSPPLGDFFVHSGTALALAVTVALAALGCTFWFERALARVLGHAPGPPSVERVVVGVPLLGSVCFVVGLVSTHAVPMGAIVVLGAVTAIVRLRGHVRAPSIGPLGWTGAAFLALVCLALGLRFVVAQLPPTHLDELAYHLRVPKAWAMAGRVVELPLNSHTYFPMGVQSASLPLFAVAGPVAGVASRMLHWLLAGLVLLSMARWLHRHLTPGSAPWACAVWATVPCLFAATGLALVEWVLLGTCLLALVGLDAWLDDDETRAPPIALVWAAGLATKYTFGLFAILVAIAGAWHLRGRRPALRRWLGAGAVGVALGAIFPLRNLLWTGNPLAPFGGADGADIDAFVDEASASSQALAYVLDPGMLDESLGAALLGAALCGLWALATGRGPRGLRTVAALSSIPLCAIAWSGYVGRIVLPFLLPAATLGLVALHRALSDARVLRHAVLFAWWTLCAGQLFATASLVAAGEPYSYFFTGERAYVAKRRSYALLEWLDTQLPADSRTLVLGLQELYVSNRDVRGGGNADGARVARYLDAGTPEALAARWRDDGFTHVAIYAPRIGVADGRARERLDAERFTFLTPAQAAVLGAALDAHARPVGTYDKLGLFALADAPSAATR